MRKLSILSGTFCLICLATILLVVIASHLLSQFKQAIQPVARSSPMMIGQRADLDRQLSVFEAVAGNSYEVFIVDNLTGQTRQLTAHFANDRFPALSPDGKQVAFVSWRDGNSEIYVIDLTTGALHNVSRHPALDILPVWSPDGTMLAFNSRRNGDAEIYLADVEHGLLHNLTNNPDHDSQPEWSSDGQRLVFKSNRSGARAQYLMIIGGREATLYQPDTEWQVAQNTGKLDGHQEAIPG